MLDAEAAEMPSPQTCALPQVHHAHSMQEIVTAVARVCGVSEADILRSDCRKRWISEVRQLAMFFCWRPPHITFSSPAVGRFFGRDHTTVIFGRSQVVERLKTSSEWQAIYNHVLRCLDNPADLPPIWVSPITATESPIQNRLAVDEPDLMRRAKAKRAKIKEQVELCHSLCVGLRIWGQNRGAVGIRG